MISVLAQKCDGCGTCVQACPLGAIRIVEGIARIDHDVCRECEVCVDACPREALVRSEVPVVVVRPTVLPEEAEPETTATVRRPSWLARAAPVAASMAGFVVREVLPVVVDRLTAPTATATDVTSSSVSSSDPSGGVVVRRQRRRHRGGRG